MSSVLEYSVRRPNVLGVFLSLHAHLFTGDMHRRVKSIGQSLNVRGHRRMGWLKGDAVRDHGD